MGDAWHTFIDEPFIHAREEIAALYISACLQILPAITVDVPQTTQRANHVAVITCTSVTLSFG